MPRSDTDSTDRTTEAPAETGPFTGRRTQGRLPWELEGGPDVPKTSDPRAETPAAETTASAALNSRGAETASPDPADDRDRNGADSVEDRAVEVADPALSPTANERLTEEVREVIGSDRVSVPSGRARPSHGQPEPSQGIGPWVFTNRVLLGMTFLGAVVVGVIVALSSGLWWLLPLAAGVHALASMAYFFLIIRMTQQIEHPAPEVAAMLTDEGVRNPDRYFGGLVDEFRPADHETPGDAGNDAQSRTTDDLDRPAQAAAEQKSAMTPTGAPSEPARRPGPPHAMMYGIIAALVVLSIVLPAIGGGGLLWVLPVIFVPAAGGWLVFEKGAARAEADPEFPGEHGSRATVIAIVTTVVVVIGVAIVAALANA